MMTSPYSLRNILVPIDMSEASLSALDIAVSLAKTHDAGLFVTYVDDGSFDFADTTLKEVASTPSTDVLSAMLHIIESRSSIRPRLIVKSGAVAPAILKASMEFNCDLIVMGKCGASGFRPLYAGSNAYNVVKYASCPVLVVPPGNRTSFNRVVFPVRPLQGALDRYDVVRCFTTFQSCLAILGLSYRLKGKDSSALSCMALAISDQMKEDHVTATIAWGGGQSIADDVLGYCMQHNGDLIVVTHAMDVTLKSCFVGAHAQQVINRSRVPVLCVGHHSNAAGELCKDEQPRSALQLS